MAADESHDDRTQSFVALTAGTDVLHYEIIDKIGAGGMGEVYLALDTKLNRKVALKFLPAHLCQADDCRARFKREAQAAAKLSHPNIIHVYEVAEYQGRPFFAMEHVEGQSLRERALGKGLSIEQTLELGIQICEGLNDAHEKGVTHRDIKPSNILIDSHGRAKIVDFGLASVVGTDHLTKTGSTLGTIGYMSPEQVRGQEIDHRSDLFSLGVVLYELITGQNPFMRDSDAATLKAVSDDTPEPLARFKTDVPELLESTLAKLLEKNPDYRYQSAADLAADLKRTQSRSSGELTVLMEPAKKRALPLLLAALAFTTVVAAVVIYLVLSGQPTQHRVAQWTQLTFVGDAIMPAISPDGERVAFVRPGSSGDSRMVMVQDLAGGSPIKVFEDKGVYGLRWSPDGNELLFSAWNDSVSGMVIVPRMGGSFRRYPIFGGWATWSPDGSKFAITSLRLYFVDKKSGDTSSIECDSNLFSADWSPNGELLVLSVTDDSVSYLATCGIDGKKTIRITDSIPAIYAVWSPRGDAVYFMEDRGENPPNLCKLHVDPHTGERKGEPILLVSNLQGGQYIYSVSADCRKLVFRQRVTSSNLWLVQLNGSGGNNPRRTQLTFGTSEVYDPAISPDGTRVVFAKRFHGEVHIFTMPVEGGDPEQITHTNISNLSPAWSPDGEQIAYVVTLGESRKIALTDTKGGVAHVIEQSQYANYIAWHPGERILYDDRPNCGLLDPVSGEKENLMTDIINGYAWSACYSPDGRKVALVATDYEGEWHVRGRIQKELAIYSVDDHSRTWAVPQDSKADLIGWSQDGLWLYLVTPGSTETTISRKRISDGVTERVVSLPWTDIYDVAMSPDCSRFVCVRRQSQSDIWLIENFDPEIE